MAPHAAAVDVTVTSLLNSIIIMEVGMYSGVAARAAEFHSENNTKRGESGWKCIPLVGRESWCLESKGSQGHFTTWPFVGMPVNPRCWVIFMVLLN